MKIIVEEKEKIITFTSLKEGDVFILPNRENPEVFIKISEIYLKSQVTIKNLLEGNAEAEDLADYESNAYSFHSNKFVWFDPMDEVVKVEAELNVHR